LRLWYKIKKFILNKKLFVTKLIDGCAIFFLGQRKPTWAKVGNLAYKKISIFDNGFIDHMKVRSGDDGLCKLRRK
jgi:hypothetical protein